MERRMPLGEFVAGALHALDADDDEAAAQFRRATGVDLRAAAAAEKGAMLVVTDDPLFQRHDAARMRCLLAFGDRITIEHLSRSSLPPSPLDSSSLSLAGLLDITVSQLASASIHGTPLTGRILQGRVVAQPVVLASIHTLVEDIIDLELVQVSISGWLPKGLTHAQEWAMAERDFSPGTLLAIRDPTVRLQLGGPACVVVRDPAQVSLMTLSYMVAGLANLHRHCQLLQQQGRCEQAVDCYTRVLRDVESSTYLPWFLGVLAAALAGLGRPGEALGAATACVQISPVPGLGARQAYDDAAAALRTLRNEDAALYFVARGMQLAPAASVQSFLRVTAACGGGGAEVTVRGLRRDATSPVVRTEAARAIAGLPLQPSVPGAAPSPTAMPASQAALDRCIEQAEQHMQSATRSADVDHDDGSAAAECRRGLAALLRVLPIAALVSSRAACALQCGDDISALLDARAALFLDPTLADAAHCAARAAQGRGWLPEAHALLHAGLRTHPADAALLDLARELGVGEEGGAGAEPGGGSGGSGEPFNTSSADAGGYWAEVARLQAQGKRQFLAGRFKHAAGSYKEALRVMRYAAPAVPVLLLRLGQVHLDQGGEGSLLRAMDYGRAHSRLASRWSDESKALVMSAQRALRVSGAFPPGASMDPLLTRADEMPPPPPPELGDGLRVAAASPADAASSIAICLDASDAAALAGDASGAAWQYEAARAYMRLLPASLLLSNRAECALQGGGRDSEGDAIDDARAALLLDPTQAKAASRLARALRAEGGAGALARLCTASLAPSAGVDPGVAEVFAAALEALPASDRASISGAGPSPACCAGCGAALGGVPPKLCPACAATPYCSTQCRKAHRKEHKRACGK